MTRHCFSSSLSEHHQPFRIALKIIGLRITAVVALAASWARPGASQDVPDRAVELASFDTAWVRVRDSYYDASLHGLDWDHLRDSLRPIVERGSSRADTRRAITALLSSLGESHFGVIPGSTMDDVRSRGETGVAGDAAMDVRFLDSILVVTRVERGTPTWAAGVRPGWTVERIDSLDVLSAWRATQSISGSAARRYAIVRLTLSLNSRLTGVAGDSIRLAMRDGTDERRNLTVHLRETPGELVEFGQLPPIHVRFDESRVPYRESCIGVIRFNVFLTPVTPRFQDAMSSFNDCRGLVLDLRGNVGGLGAMIVGLSSYLLAKPETLGTMRIRGGTMRYVSSPVKVTRTGARTAPFGGPLAILVDELSASTTEILTAALQSLGRARVFGTRTAGQALPAVVTALPNGDRLMYVVADFVGPDGRRIEGEGVAPDVLMPRDRGSLLEGHDAPLDAALAWLKSGDRTRASQP